MMRAPAWFLYTLLWSMVAPALAAEEALMCFGTEPFWGLDLTKPGIASFSTPDSSAAGYRGAANTLSYRPETIWRGRATPPERGDLVAFLREESCSDTMSDIEHPFAVNVSLPDGRHLSGCCRRVQPQAASVSLEDRSWRLTRLPGGEDVTDLGQGAPTVTFSGGRVHGFSGCNQFMGGYTREGDTLELGQMAGTMMACADPRIDILERQFLAALSGRLVVSMTDSGLQLAPEKGGEPLQFKAAAAPRLEGVEWEVTGFNNGRQAVVSPKLGSSVTLKFEDGTVSGSAGCNRFTGDYEASGESLSIKPLATTRMACDAELMEQEQRFLAALQSATTWSVFRGMLDVHRTDGERVLMANPVKRQ